jgi:2-polyprenyl-3-methyl-5-hydroxy-6-metoxy-1,4-benzoquinol methylase
VNHEDNWESHWENFSDSASDNPAQIYRHHLIQCELEKVKYKTLIDFGSGQGDLLSSIDEKVEHKRLIGFELSQSGIQAASKKVKSAEFHKVNLYEPEKLLNKELLNVAEVGVCSEVLEHLDHPEVFLKNIKKFLKKDAVLIVTVPGGIRTAFDKFIGHKKHYNAEELRKLFVSSEFKVRQINCWGFPFFNFYKMIVYLRGNSLVKDASEKDNSQSSLAKFVMKVFRILFAFNLGNSPWGWQLIAVVEPINERN